MYVYIVYKDEQVWCSVCMLCKVMYCISSCVCNVIIELWKDDTTCMDLCSHAGECTSYIYMYIWIYITTYVYMTI